MITQKHIAWAIGLAALLLLPLLIRMIFPGTDRYYLHLVIQILIWAFIYTGWSMMGRFGLTSLGHGAFTGIGAYVTVMLWNFAGITPWIGIPVAMLVATIAGMLVGYPCFRMRITGHYFALLTLAFTEFIRLCIIGMRDWTGGSLGTQPTRYGDGLSLYAVQFEPNRVLAYYIVLAVWLIGLMIWVKVDRSMDRYALDAASQDEDAAASVGINVTREKLKITALSSAEAARTVSLTWPLSSSTTTRGPIASASSRLMPTSFEAQDADRLSASAPPFISACLKEACWSPSS